MEKKITKILIAVGLALVFIGLVVSNCIYAWKSTNTALVMAAMNERASCQNEVNQMIANGKLIVNNQVVQPTEQINTQPNE